VRSTSLTLTAAKDSVVRNNPFVVTIQGDSLAYYGIYLENAQSGDKNPELQPNQEGWQNDLDSDEYVSGAVFKTDASGKRNVQYNTAADTEDKTYTIKVMAKKENAEEFDWTVYDTTKVKVEKGAVTISAFGDGSYFIGDEIKLTGTNTDSSNIFLFITGTNLASDGLQLKQVQNKTAYARYNALPVSVETDNTWEYKWDTSGSALDTGAYTIYATSILTNGKASDAIKTDSTYGEKDADGNYWAVKFSDSEYATVSVNLKQPFLSAKPSGTLVAKGDKIYIRGTAAGNPTNLKLFIFGPNYFADHSITVEDDGTYEKKLDIDRSLSSNQYFVVIQHPMYNGKFDVQLNTEDDERYFEIQSPEGYFSQSSFYVEGPNKLQGSQAADALTKMIDSPNIDDIYTKLTFTVEEPWIKIKNPGDQAI
jgi:hypothetical protein